jgi:hypothetical protein
MVMNALYSYEKNGVVECLLATHVDDLIWACTESAQGIIDGIRKELVFGTEEEWSFRFCGTEIEQNPETYEIVVTCKHTSERLTPINIPTQRAKESEAPVTATEKEQLMSVTGSLMWICRCCRPGIAYGVSRLQSLLQCATVEELKLASKLVKHVREDTSKGLTYRSTIPWPETPGEPVRLCIAAVSDASHGSESEFQGEWQVRENFRSQGGRLVFLSDSRVRDQDQASVHLIGFGSSILKRVVNSTIKAETYQLTDVVEAADLVRAAVADCHGAISNPSRWESEAAAWTTSVWFTDCKSCYDTLQRPIAKSVDKRLGMELASLRQHLWRGSGFDVLDARALEEKPAEPTDVIRWIDTSVMVADCLTKMMRDDLLDQVLADNHWDFSQSAEAKETKARKQTQRSRVRGVQGSSEPPG